MSPVETRENGYVTEYKGADGNWYPATAKRRLPGRTEGETADAACTRRNRAMLEAGKHPVSKLRLLESAPPRTCGECAHHIIYAHSKNYHKCDLNRTSGPATDIRVSWPACTAFEVAS